MTKIELNCCEGKPANIQQCLKDRCPIYNQAKREVQSGHPYVGTGYGNLYPEPTDKDYLARVRKRVSRIGSWGTW